MSVMPNFIWEKFNHPKLSDLKKRYKLEEVVSSGKTEFDKHILLRDWVNKALPLGTPKDYKNLSTFDILEDAKNGYGFWCTQYAFVFLQCATALGWYTRKPGIDCDHTQDQMDKHHGIAEFFSHAQYDPVTLSFPEIEKQIESSAEAMGITVEDMDTMMDVERLRNDVQIMRLSSISIDEINKYNNSQW